VDNGRVFQSVDSRYVTVSSRFTHRLRAANRTTRPVWHRPCMFHFSINEYSTHIRSDLCMSVLKNDSLLGNPTRPVFRNGASHLTSKTNLVSINIGPMFPLKLVQFRPRTPDNRPEVSSLWRKCGASITQPRIFDFRVYYVQILNNI